jgi:hypothetical protein
MNDMQVLLMEWQEHRKPVGASLLAKVANNGACYLDKRVALRFFASKLAPTGGLRSLSTLAQKKRHRITP